MLESGSAELDKRVRTMQIVAGALLAGVGVFLVVVLFLRSENQAFGAVANGMPIITYVAVVFLIVDAPLAFVVPRLMLRTALRQIAQGVWRPPGGSQSLEV